VSRRTISLDGTWDVIFDENETLKADCFKKVRKTHAVEVPGVWEQARPFYDGQGFYRRRFTLPANLGGKLLRLKFGAVNYYAEAFLNGKRIGEHEGGYTPFVFDITKVAKLGEENELVVRVIDPPRRREIQGFRSGAPLSQSDIPTWKAGWYFNFGGIWQPVEIIVTEPLHVDDVFVQPQADLETVKFDVTLVNGCKAGRYTVVIDMAPKSGDEKTGVRIEKTVTLAKGINTIRCEAKVARPHLWSPEDPFLYTTTVSVSDATSRYDALSVTCGIRFFTAEDGVFKLNGQRIAVRGFLQQGVYPRTLVLPASKADARKELMLLKNNGMNFIRAHLKPPPIHLDLADELGILLMEEPPIGWIRNTPHTIARCTREVRELVRRDRNRPSVVMWCLLNEATHYRTFTPSQLSEFERAVANACRDNDMTRLCVTNSGGSLGSVHTESTVMCFLPFEKKPTRLMDLHAYCAIPLPASSVQHYRAHGGGDTFKPDGVNFVSSVAKRKSGRNPKDVPALLISEFGAFENPPDYEKVLSTYTPAERKLGLEDYVQHKNYYESLKEQFKKSRLGEIFGSVDGLIRASQELHREDIRAIVSAMRANPRNSGWVFTQLADASGELFGATDIWRNPRRWFKDMAIASQTPLIVPHVSTRVVGPRDTLGINLRIVNENTTGVHYTWKLRVVGAGGRTTFAKTGDVRAKGWVQEVLDEPIQAPAKGGRYTVEAELRAGSKLLSSNSIRFTVIEPAEAPCDRIGMFDMDDTLRPVLQGLGIAQVDKANNNYRYKNVPCIYLPRPHQHLGLINEYNQQLRRIVTLGGAGLVIEAQTPMLYDKLTPTLIRLDIPMRNMLYMRPSSIWDGLPTSNGMMDYEFADVFSGRANPSANAEDVAAAGGTSLCGTLCAHMWTGPEIYQHGSFINVIPVGRGHLVFCQLTLAQQAATNPVAKRLLANLIRFTASLVKKGGEEKLLSRCIDNL
jgi:hypothetical protein